jgi:hypothetical protein
MTALLSHTSAMACSSWSLPAGPGYCAGIRGAVCASCYAGQGMYNFPNVKHTQSLRWQWWRSARESERISTLVAAIRKRTARNPYFRVFDSGDFSCPQDVLTWAAIARTLPKVRFWIPTRTWWLPEFVKPLRVLAALPNVALRVSTIAVNGEAPSDWPCASRVVSTGSGCPKQTAGDCATANCRACWDKTVPLVEYRMHGHAVSWSHK